MIAALLVALVDDDESVRESLPDLLRELGYEARAFDSAEAFLADDVSMSDAGCLILDVVMPGMSGPDLHAELLRRGRTIPTLFISALPGLALPSGPKVASLRKPFSEQELRGALAKLLPGA